MKLRNIILASSFVIFSGAITLGCDNEPAEGKTKVVAQEATEAPTAAPSGSAVEYKVSSSDGSVEFVGAKITAKHEGKFSDFNGAISVVDGSADKGTVKVSIAIPSMQIEPEKLRGHLMSADFFDAEKFPTAEFTSTSIKAEAKDGNTHLVTGNLDLHGVKKSISFPAKINVTEGSVSVDAEFAINRKDFGLVYPGMPDDLIKDDVLIKIKLEPKKS